MRCRRRPTWRAAALIAAAAGAGIGCGDADPEVVDAASTCDRLEELGVALLDVVDATTPQEIRDGVDGPLDAFTAAAMSSGDDRLEELADIARERFDVYLDAEGLDAREAGNDANVALDRAAERCLELGADNDFPQDPG